MLLFEERQEGLYFFLEHDVLFVNLLLQGPEDLFKVLLHHQLGMCWLQLVGVIHIVHREAL